MSDMDPDAQAARERYADARAGQAPVEGGESASAADEVSAHLRVVRGNPTEEELAAVTAVLSALAEEVRATHRRTPQRRATAWAAVQRPLRQPIVPGITRWRGFSG